MKTWTFITNHGAVLACIGQRSRITAREIAAYLGITERSVLRIINDLVQTGYVSKERVGRANNYKINPRRPLRRSDQRDVMIGDLLSVLSKME
jgi:predicted ArsR family transcriptional regulator